MDDGKLSSRGGRLIAGSAIRVLALCCVVGAALSCAGCEKEADRKARDAAALQSKFNAQMQADNAATRRALEERARADREASKIRAVETHAESQEAFARYIRERPSMNEAEEAIAAELGVSRIREKLTEPEGMEVRNAHMNTERNTLCTEVNYKEGGKYLGFRRAFVTADAIWVEPGIDEVSHRVFEINFKRMGCDKNAPAPPR